MMRFQTIVIVVLFQLVRTETDDCQYSTPDGTLDLRAFSERTRPKYTDIRDTSPQSLLKYSFNGCYSYSTGQACVDAAACATDLATQRVSLIAKQAGRTFHYIEGLSTLQYTNGGDIKLNVFLVCSQSESFKATRNDDMSFLFYIESKCACPGKCPYKPSDNGGLGSGAIFVIVLICLAAAYLLFGAIYLRFLKKETGTNIIPNRNFWLQTFSDFLGGVRFVLTMCCARGQKYESV